jgi:hypothetical protein
MLIKTVTKNCSNFHNKLSKFRILYLNAEHLDETEVCYSSPFKDPDHECHHDIFHTRVHAHVMWAAFIWLRLETGVTVSMILNLCVPLKPGIVFVG